MEFANDFLKDKNILIGISGSIAAYKMANIAHKFVKLGANVQVMMTKNACNFINSITFETLTQNKCLIDTFDRNFQYSVEHVSAAQSADCVLIAPASANIIGKLANGIADDMLTTTVMAAPCVKIIAPAMNHFMYHNDIVQNNLNKLQNFGYKIITPEYGSLANGNMGDGRMPDDDIIIYSVLKEIAYKKYFEGKRILVTAGSTKEKIDPVRYISNNSTGKMGVAIATDAMLRGADVTLIHGDLKCDIPPFIKDIHTESAQNMYNAVMEIYTNYDIIIMAAAVADFTPENYSVQKVKKSDNDENISLELKRTKDILYTLGHNRVSDQFICGFSMETENLIENSKKKLNEKNIDMIIANSISSEGSGFGCDTNIVTIITKKTCKSYPKMNKLDVGNIILDSILEI